MDACNRSTGAGAMPIIAMPSPDAGAWPAVDRDATLPADAVGALRGLVPSRPTCDPCYRGAVRSSRQPGAICTPRQLPVSMPGTCCAPAGLVPKQPPTLIAIALTHGPVQLRVRRRRDADDCSAPPGAVDASVVDRDATLPGCRGVGVGGVKQPGRARLYFSLRQLMEPRFSTVLDSTSMSKPRRSRYFRVITEPLPTSDTP